MARHQGIGEAGLGHDHGGLTPRVTVERTDALALAMPAVTGPSSDGTATWTHTTMVIAQVRGGGELGIGYSYVDAAAADVIENLLAPAIAGVHAFAINEATQRMLVAVRNHGRAGVAACAISAVDAALWDLKGKLLGVPLAELLGPARARVPVYASGGFTSRTLDQLASEITAYAEAGHARVKIKVGREPWLDEERVRVAREAAGPAIELMVDANGAYTRTQAIAMAERFARYAVTWFEEPVSSDHLEDLAAIRARAPAGMAIAAGEYAYDSFTVRRMLDAGAVDVMQADATRCLGVSGFLRADALADARGTPLSAHCAPAVHVHAGAAALRLIHVEQFLDHAHMERVVFDGAPEVDAGALVWDPKRPGLGLILRVAEAERHAI